MATNHGNSTFKASENHIWGAVLYTGETLANTIYNLSLDLNISNLNVHISNDVQDNVVIKQLMSHQIDALMIMAIFFTALSLC